MTRIVEADRSVAELAMTERCASLFVKTFLSVIKLSAPVIFV